MMKETAFTSMGKTSMHRVGKYTLKYVRKTRKAVLKVTDNVNVEFSLSARTGHPQLHREIYSRAAVHKPFIRKTNAYLRV